MVDREIKFSEVLEVEEAIASLLLGLEESTGMVIEDMAIYREKETIEDIPSIAGTKLKLFIPASIER